jgi:hypothetical protein
LTEYQWIIVHIRSCKKSLKHPLLSKIEPTLKVALGILMGKLILRVTENALREMDASTPEANDAACKQAWTEYDPE